MSSAPNLTATVPRREVIKVTMASLIGTTLEFYDFLVYGYVASVLAALFFPSSSRTASMLAVFASFAVGYLGRPLGAIVFGHVGDRIGRRQTLMVTLTLMGLASFLTALLPTYEQVGVLAPTLLVILRLFQGLALGGEFGTGVTLTGEVAPKQHRGFWIAITQMSQGFGGLLPVGSVVIATSLMGASAFAATGWRWLFGLGVLIAVVGVAVRTGIAESPLFQKKEAAATVEKVPILELLTKHWKPLINAIGFGMQGTVLIYLTGVFAVAYLELVVKVSLATASLIIAIASIASIVVIPVAGALADKIGRRPVAIIGMVGCLVFIYPYYLLLSTGVLSIMIIDSCIIAFFEALTVSLITVLPEMFPTRVRVSGVSLAYQLLVTIFGGTTPLIATYLIAATHWSLAPMIWGIIAEIISIIAIFVIQETRGKDLATAK